MINIDDLEWSDEQLDIMSGLTDLQKRFAIHLAAGAKSYHEAHVKAGAERPDRPNAWRMWQNPRVQTLYYSLLKYPLKESLIQREEALDMLSKMAAVQVTDVCDVVEVQIGEDEFGLPVYSRHMVLKDLNALPDHVRAAIKSIKQTKFGVNVELYGREEALKQARAMQGWDAASKHDLTSTDGSMTPAVIERRIVDPKA